MPLDPRNYASNLASSAQDPAAAAALLDLAQKLQQLATDLGGYFVPTGGIILTLGSACPAGFTEVVALRNAFPMGNPLGGTVGATGGASSHTHGTSALTMTGPSTVVTTQDGTGIGHSPADSAHMHTIHGYTDAASLLPPYVQMLFCQKT